MRIATANAYANAITNLQARQERLTDAQTRLTSGLRVMKASDDPAAAARAERLLAHQTRAEVSLRAVEASRATLTLGESALGDGVELLQQAREAVMAAGNGTFSPAERAMLAGQLRELRGQLLAVANRSDAAGNFLFGGQAGSSAPFVDSPSGVGFAGVPGTTRVGSPEPLPSSFDGFRIWMGLPGGQSVFDGLDTTIAALDDSALDGTQVQQAVTQGLAHLDASLDQLQAARSEAGETLRRIDAMTDRLGQTIVHAETDRSAAIDLDLISAISSFQNQQSGYQAALQSYAQVQQMSLFQFLR